VICAFFIGNLSLKFGRKMTYEWMMNFLWALSQDILFHQPSWALLVYLFALYLLGKEQKKYKKTYWIFKKIRGYSEIIPVQKRDNPNNP
jgi:hypothetical protein